VTRPGLCAAAAALSLLSMIRPALAAERVVALGPHLAELSCAAGGCEQLVGVIAYSNFPERVKQLPVVGDAAQINLEALLALRPTLVLAWDGGTSPTTIDRLRGLGLRVEPVHVSKLPEVADALEQIGRWLGTGSVADAAAADYRRRLAVLATRYAKAKPLKVFYQIETAPAYTVNGDSPISQAIGLCGGRNVFASLPTLAAPVNDESVLTAQPEVVIHSDHDGPAMLAYWSRFPKSTPMARGQIYGIDADLLARAGPRLIDGAELLCATLDLARR